MRAMANRTVVIPAKAGNPASTVLSSSAPHCGHHAANTKLRRPAPSCSSGYGRDVETNAPEPPISDAELTALALAADPDAPVDDDAVPFGAGEGGLGLLPAWYMPTPAGHRRGRGPALVVSLILLSLLAVNAVGLCVTNGFLEIAW